MTKKAILQPNKAPMPKNLGKPRYTGQELFRQNQAVQAGPFGKHQTKNDQPQ